MDKYTYGRKRNQEQYEQQSKERLIKNIEKKFQTTMIGALARFEDEFGDLWGMDKDRLTPEEEKWEEKWKYVRNEVLNNGNNQLRACLDELSNYTLSWNQYHTEFLVRKRDL